MKSPEDFIQRVKSLHVGESQQSFAQRLGITQVKLSRIETGKFEPDIDTLISLCKVSGATADWLLGLSPEGGPKGHDAALSALRNEVADLARRIDEALSGR